MNEKKTAKELVQQMTLEEKCSMLSGMDFWHTQPIPRLGIPAVMVSDGPHGLRKQADKTDHLGLNESIPAVCFPAACAMAASFDRSLLRQVGETMGDQCQHEQVGVNLGPAINIKRSPLCGRNFEYMSEDPYLTGELAVSLIQGVQSKNVGVSVKHFAANNQEHRRMSSDSVVDERTLREIYLPAFEAAAKQGRAWTFMCSYNKVNGEFASQNRWLLTDLLREEWGFDGYVMSDWGAVSDRIKGVEAGLDLEMPGSSGERDRAVLQAVQEGRLDEKYVDQAVEHILDVNLRYLNNARPDTPWDKEADHALAGRLAAECMVLLKNEDGVLPLRKEEKVTVIGEFAAKPRYQGGGSSHINSFKVTSLLDILTDGQNVHYAQGYVAKSEKNDPALFAEAIEAAKAADKAVVVAGLPDSFESEGYDRTHMRMPENQIALIEAVAQANPNTVVLLYNGSPIEMPWIDDVKGVVEGYLGGENIGWASRAVLYGEVNPCGRLPETLPEHLEDTPCFLTYGGEGNRAEYTEGLFVGYRWYTGKLQPVLFPFGYGLSYTQFKYGSLTLSTDHIKDTETLTVKVDVTNIGKLPGKEVVQLYVAPPKSDLIRPVRELKGFEKVALEPGETKTVSFTLDERSFAYWNTILHDWHVLSGDYDIQICRNAEDVDLAAIVHVTGTKIFPRHYDVDTIIMDLDENAMSILQESMQAMMGSMTSEDQSEDSAISAEMSMAMMRYMPLRTFVSFSGMTLQDLNWLVDRLNKGREGRKTR